jgi:ring-1,2-phenylacetyl-CoA epoxidase subunit PaaE
MRALSPPPPASRHTLHALRVTEVEPLTDDALAITFAVPEELREVYAFAPGQHVALVRDHGGEQIRRSYSVCSPVDGPLRVAVKRLPDGAFSGWAHQELKVGDELRVMPPSGRFTVDLDLAQARHYAAVAAGSGITPVISILASALAVEPASRCTLIYGNRSTSSIMFLEELEDLKDRYGPRLQLIHVLSREPRDLALLEGRIDGPKLARLLDTLLKPDTVDEWFLCGPFGMVEAARSTLLAGDVPATAIHRELFHGDGAAPPLEPSRRAADDQGEGASVTLVLDGRRSVARVPHDGAPILDAMLAERADAPYACKGGVCGTCRCRVTEGEVRMDRAYALEPDEIEAGIVLACQSHPVTDTVVLDFDGV